MGWLPLNDGRAIVIYDFKQQRYERYGTDFGSFPIWLNDNRRIVFHERERLFLLDRVTGKWQQIMALKPPSQFGHYAFSRDNRRLYYTSWNNEADIWMLNLERAGK